MFPVNKILLKIMSYVIFMQQKSVDFAGFFINSTQTICFKIVYNDLNSVK